MINYNDNDMDFYNNILKDILKYLKIDVTDEEVWDVAREQECIPCFEDTLFDLCCNAIEYELEERGIEVELSRYINSADSHLYIDSKEIFSVGDFTEAIEKV
jgi:protoporphyrinogen oxidase